MTLSQFFHRCWNLNWLLTKKVSNCCNILAISYILRVLSHFHINEANEPESKMTLRAVDLSRWQQLLSTIAGLLSGLYHVMKHAPAISSRTQLNPEKLQKKERQLNKITLHLPTEPFTIPHLFHFFKVSGHHACMCVCGKGRTCNKVRLEVNRTARQLTSHG